VSLDYTTADYVVPQCRTERFTPSRSLTGACRISFRLPLSPSFLRWRAPFSESSTSYSRDVPRQTEGFVDGAIIGTIVAFCAATAEYTLFMRSLSRFPLIAIVVLRLVLWCGIVVLGMWIADLDPRFYETAVIFSVIMGTAFTFIVYLRRLIGARTMLRFLTGRYNRPREEERVFLFADIKGSTTIAERIGNRLYQEFLNDVWFDISDAVAACAGEIYKYVGDEIIVTWSVRWGVANARCLRLCAAIPGALARRAASYQRRYGVTPEIRQGLHAGLVTVGEMGDARMEIAYLGDVLNTTARLVSYADELKIPALISGDVVRLLPHVSELPLRNLGPVNLRGKEHRIRVYALA